MSKADRAARRAELLGIGPTSTERPEARWPGATARFALFGEVLAVGLMVTLLALPLVTIPLAFGVGIRHLRRFLRAESSTLGSAWSDTRRGFLGSLPIGFALLVALLVLGIDLAVAADRIIPFPDLVGLVGWLGLAVVAVTVLTASFHWAPESGWRAALRLTPPTWRTDPAGVAYLLAAVAFVAVVSWQLAPLIVPGLGCLVFAIVAIPERPRRG